MQQPLLLIDVLCLPGPQQQPVAIFLHAAAAVDGWDRQMDTKDK